MLITTIAVCSMAHLLHMSQSDLAQGLTAGVFVNLSSFSICVTLPTVLLATARNGMTV